MKQEKLQLNCDELRFIQILMTQCSYYGVIRGLDTENAIQLYNKIQKMIDEYKEKDINSNK